MCHFRSEVYNQAMSERRQPSKADQVLLQTLAEAGLPNYSGRTIESWREEGVLPTAAQEWLGRGRGSTSSYPPEARQQAVAVARLLKRHRSFDKTAALLWLHGYEVDPARIRKSLLTGVDYLDRQLAKYDRGDPDKTARAIAKALVSERIRSKTGREWAQKQIEDAGGRDQLEQAYAGLARMFIGGVNLGGFLAAYKNIGQDFRQLTALDQQAWAKFEHNMDSQFAEINAAGGITNILRQVIPQAPPEGLDWLRNYLPEVRQWLDTIGVQWSTPPGTFLSDVDQALVHPEARKNGSSPDT
jgi:hypothetical protein